MQEKTQQNWRINLGLDRFGWWTMLFMDLCFYCEMIKKIQKLPWPKLHQFTDFFSSTPLGHWRWVFLPYASIALLSIYSPKKRSFETLLWKWVLIFQPSHSSLCCFGILTLGTCPDFSAFPLASACVFWIRRGHSDLEQLKERWIPFGFKFSLLMMESI